MKGLEAKVVEGKMRKLIIIILAMASTTTYRKLQIIYYSFLW